MNGPDSGPLGDRPNRPHHPEGWNPGREFKPVSGDKKLPDADELDGWGSKPGRTGSGNKPPQPPSGGQSSMSDGFWGEFKAQFNLVVNELEDAISGVQPAIEKTESALAVAALVADGTGNQLVTDSVGMLSSHREDLNRILGEMQQAKENLIQYIGMLEQGGM